MERNEYPPTFNTALVFRRLNLECGPGSHPTSLWHYPMLFSVAFIPASLSLTKTQYTVPLKWISNGDVSAIGLCERRTLRFLPP